MNTHRFDALTRALGARGTRRAALGGLAATGGIALIGKALAQDTATPDAETTQATPAAGPLRVRKNAASLTAAEKEAFTNAILALKAKPSPWINGLSTYDTFVLWHRDAFNCDIMAAHMGPAFLPWHRVFLHLFEQQLQSVEPSVNLPYWDWTVDNTPESPIWADDLMGGDGDPKEQNAVLTGPFKKGSWEITVFDYADAVRSPFIVRSMGTGFMAKDLPTAEDLDAALAIAAYDAAPWNSTVAAGTSFRNQLEGWQDCVSETCDPVSGMGPKCVGPHNLHNRVHLWVAGEFRFASQTEPETIDGTPVPVAIPSADPATDLMGTMSFNSSPNDPVFFLHHTNIDRIWTQWAAKHGNVYEPTSGASMGMNADDMMWPYAMLGMHVTPNMALTTEAFGYTYE